MSQLCRNYGYQTGRIDFCRGLDCENIILKFQKAADKHEIIRKILRTDFIRFWNYSAATYRKEIMDKYSAQIEAMLPEHAEKLKNNLDI